MTATVYVVGNFKGGTSKTTIATMLAYQTSVFRKEKTLVIDMDTQANASIKLAKTGDIENIDRSITRAYMDGNLSNQIMEINEYLDLIPCDNTFRHITDILNKKFPKNKLKQVTYLKEMIKPLLNRYDRIFIDVPPSYSDYADNAIMASDYAIIALQMQEMSVQGARNYVEYMNFMAKTYGANIQVAGLIPVLVKSEGRSEIATQDMARNYFGDSVLDSVLTHQERLKIFDIEGIHYRVQPNGSPDMWDKRAHDTFSSIWDELMENQGILES